MTLVTLAHAGLFAALAVPLSRPMRASSEAVDVELVGPIHLGERGRIVDPPPLAAPPVPAPLAPPAPAEPSAVEPAPPPVSPIAPAPIKLPSPTESVADLAARLIRDTASTELAAAPLEIPSAASPPPPSSPAPPQSASAPAVAACEIGGALQASLQTDGAVQAALASIPGKERSVAGAVMLWDGAWADPASMGGEGVIAPVRAAILGGVLAASPDCRQRPITGPRFIIVPARTGATVVTIGSGIWRWADLLETYRRQ